MHADNPIDWYEWGEEALQKAKKENKPLLISIGYASCHWCHVMEKESFMDTSVAKIMNDNFINIKVDREERPDIDNIYMNACQLLTGGGGWPLNAFALPDGKPFFAGTYYIKKNWKNLLKQIAETYKTKYNKVEMQALSLTKGIMDYDLEFIKTDKESTTVNDQTYKNYFDILYPEIDFTNGGLKSNQKFPMPSVWEFLLQYHYLKKDNNALRAVTNSLTKMAMGGIYDQLGGGFARYATDTLWHIPHFEKMLYDNGQLMSLYAKAYQVTKNNFYKNIVYKIAEFVETDLTSDEGGFYSSLNADSENGEGEYYAWTASELKKILGQKNGALLADYYNVSEKGNWEESKNILFTTDSPEEFAATHKLPVNDFSSMLNRSMEMLLNERNKRLKPGIDSKILSSWNALMLKGYLDAYITFGDHSFIQKALKSASFIEQKMLNKQGHLYRNFIDGKATIDGFLDDYAFVANAFIRLYEVSFDQHWLNLARIITEYAIANFYDNNSKLFFYNSSASDQLIVRKIETQDDVIPSSNAVMAEVLYKLSVLLENNDFLEKATLMFAAVSDQILKTPVYYTKWCSLGGLLYKGTYEIAIMGTQALQKNLAMQHRYLPTCIFMGSVEKEDLPLLENKMVPEKTMIYVCTNRTCKLPVEDVDKALTQIK
jgi:uncharacterized protein YyaL (SSP411 family)